MDLKLIPLLLLAVSGVLCGVDGSYSHMKTMCAKAMVQLCINEIDLEDFDVVNENSTMLGIGCAIIDDIEQCVRHAFKACKMDEIKELYIMIDVFREVCKPGSEMNRKFTNSIDCLLPHSWDILSSSSCLKGMKQLLKDMIDEPSLAKLLEIICEGMPSVLKCFYSKAEELCSKDARDVLSAFTDPYANLMMTACKDKDILSEESNIVDIDGIDY